VIGLGQQILAGWKIKYSCRSLLPHFEIHFFDPRARSAINAERDVVDVAAIVNAQEKRTSWPYRFRGFKAARSKRD
jgi:hypothetical protein